MAPANKPKSLDRLILCTYNKCMNIEFDPAKAEANMAKHGVSLALAAEIEWSDVLCAPDSRRDYGELREIGFAAIFAATPDGLRVAHAPVVLNDDSTMLQFHLSRGN